MPDIPPDADCVRSAAFLRLRASWVHCPHAADVYKRQVQTVMKDKGMAHIGIGNAKGDEKAIEAVKLAVASPLLETTDRKSTRLNSSHSRASRMPSSA